MYIPVWNDESYLQWRFITTWWFLMNWTNKGCQLELFLWYEIQIYCRCSQIWKCYTCHMYMGHSGFQAVACAALFFFTCFLFIAFFFSCPCFCLWMLSWIFCLNFFFWLLIFSSSALLLASRSGSWKSRLIPNQQQAILNHPSWFQNMHSRAGSISDQKPQTIFIFQHWALLQMIVWCFSL